MASAVAPIISTSYLSSTPIFCSDSAQLSAVCPPIVGSSAKPPGIAWRSVAMILATTSGVIGSTYVRSAMSGSVMIVAGLELTSTMR